jgi:hypothetical protein
MNVFGGLLMTYIFTEQGLRHTPREWLSVGQSVSDLANKWAERGDILAYVGEGAGQGSPACFYHATGELELDVVKAFGPIDPETIGPLTDRQVRYEHPRAVGLIAHESFHARFTLYDKERCARDLSPKEHQALTMLEESRIESHGIIYEPSTRSFLRACVRDLILPDALETLSAGQGAVSVVALIEGRVQAGVFSRAEVSGVLEQAKEILGESLYNALSSVVRRAQAHYYHRDATELCELAKEWAELVKDAPGGSEEDESTAGQMKALVEALGEALDTVELQAYSELMDQDTMEGHAEDSKARAQMNKVQRDNEDLAESVFGIGTQDMEDLATDSRLQDMRTPNPAERIAAVTIAKELEKAKYHDRVEIEMSLESPPGRLKTRALMQREALKSKGIRGKSEPWRRTIRKHSVDPTLTVGVMVDISGSMHSAMEPMATTAWVMSEAVRRVQGRVAMVYYGQDVFPTLKPGEHLDEVRVYSAVDRTERFDKAFRALDGGLNLLMSEGARLLVIASDGNYTHEEIIRARHWLTRCAESGVAVLWLPFDEGSSARSVLGREGFSNVMIVPGTLQPEQTAVEIGRAAALALTRAGQ